MRPRSGFWAMAKAEAVEFAYTEDGPGGLKLSSETFTLKADQVFKAIGQTLAGRSRRVWRSTGGKLQALRPRSGSAATARLAARI